MNQPEPTHFTLSDVVNNFHHWRSTRTKRGKIPSELMDQACSLIGRYPLTKISSSLSICHSHFRQQAIKRGVLADNKSAPTLVEVSPGPTFGNKPQSPIMMEIMRPDGAKLTIQVGDHAIAGSLMHQFLEEQ